MASPSQGVRLSANLDKLEILTHRPTIGGGQVSKIGDPTD